VGVGIGWSWGKGVLSFKGKQYPFKVDGICVVDVGITKANAVGKVYHLKKLSDFNGTTLPLRQRAHLVEEPVSRR
jgi:hypothetical protein